MSPSFWTFTSLVSAFLHLADSIFFHLSVCLFPRSFDHQLLASLMLHSSDYRWLPFFVRPSWFPCAHTFPRLSDASYHRTFVIPSSNNPISLLLCHSIPSKILLTVHQFSPRSFSVSFCYSTALLYLFSCICCSGTPSITVAVLRL